MVVVVVVAHVPFANLCMWGIAIMWWSGQRMLRRANARDIKIFLSSVSKPAAKNATESTERTGDHSGVARATSKSGRRRRRRGAKKPAAATAAVDTRATDSDSDSVNIINNRASASAASATAFADPGGAVAMPPSLSVGASGANNALNLASGFPTWSFSDAQVSPGMLSGLPPSPFFPSSRPNSSPNSLAAPGPSLGAGAATGSALGAQLPQQKAGNGLEGWTDLALGEDLLENDDEMLESQVGGGASVIVAAVRVCMMPCMTGRGQTVRSVFLSWFPQALLNAVFDDSLGAGAPPSRLGDTPPITGLLPSSLAGTLGTPPNFDLDW